MAQKIEPKRSTILSLPPLTEIKGVGDAMRLKLAKLGVATSEDLLYFFPRRYDDFSVISKVATARPGPLTVKGTITITNHRYSRRGLHITEGYVQDDTGRIPITWFNQPYRAQSIASRELYYVSGEYDLNNSKLSFVNPNIERLSEMHDGSLVLPHYREIKGVSSRQISKLVNALLAMIPTIPERLPEDVVSTNNLLPLDTCIRQLHFPKSIKELEEARQRLSFEELFHLQLASELQKDQLKQERAPQIEFQESLAKDFVAALPYKLTDDQRRVAWEIFQDMNRTEPMNRLVEGDVGSGKTVVAAMAAVMAVNAGYQVLYMAPTELLARQHAETFYELLSHTAWKDQIGLLVGSLKSSVKKALHERVAGGKARILIGTHALIQDAVATENVGLVIIDEQHRFGVDQRQKLRKKAGLFPHVLCMTATPIPRTLALTLYGELDISIIGTMPVGRKEIETKVVLFPARANVYHEVDDQIEQGRQAFIVTPLISESSVLQTKAAETLYEELRTGLLRHRRLALLHGAMKAEDKELIMAKFVAGELDALVATTVIEVGVNVPNASVMVIEGAERFGLASLHQLRGRIGRGAHQGYCYLIPSQDIGMTRRMRAIASTTNGFKLAELDLELRGPGAIYGTRQSGSLDLSYANLGDRTMIMQAKKAARDFIDRGNSLVQYSYLEERVRHFQSVSKLN